MVSDTAMAAQFLSALAGDAQFTFQTFAEADKGGRSLSRILYGTFAQRAGVLQSANDKGAGVFVMVNRGDGMGRKAANVTGARALFVDLDGAPLEPVLAGPIRPRIVVESSPGKWHCYWPVADLPLERFTGAQKALAARFGGDPVVHDRARVMRLPGFLHLKGEPFLTRLHECLDASLTWSEMVEAFGLEDRLTLPATIPAGQRNETLYKLAASAARMGVPESEQLRKAEQVNASRCQPPLPATEVAQVVASAYKNPPQGVAAIPLEVLDSNEFVALDDPARVLAMLAYRRSSSFNEFTLPWTELRRWFPRKDTFHAVRKRLVDSGLLQVTKASVPAMPRKARGPKPTFYRLAIGPFGVAYSIPEIGPFGVAPEALQVVAIEGASRSAANAKTETKPSRFKASGPG